MRILSVLVGVLALAAVAAPTWLNSPTGPAVISLPPIPSLDAGLRWTDTATPADAIQRLAVDRLLGWLVVLGWGALAVGGITALALWGTLAGQRVPEVAIRRAVGASRRSLTGAVLGEGLGIGAVVIAIGTALGLLGARAAAAVWPGPSSPGSGVSIAAPILIGAAMVVGALFPLWSARSRNVTERVETPPPLWIPAIQLGASLAMLVGTAMIAGRAGASLATPNATAAAGDQVYQLESHAGSEEVRASDYGVLLADLRRRDSSSTVSLASPGEGEGIGTVDQLTTDCGQCYVGGIYLKWRPLRANYHTASADTFRAQGFPILEGRAFTDEDRLGTAPVAIVNRYLAARYFESGRPLGRELFPAGRMIGTAYRVVGVVDDRGARGLGGELGPLETVYLSTLQVPGKHTELLLTGGRASELPLPNGITSGGRTTRAAIAERRAAVLRWFGRMFGLEGAATLLLSLGGIGILMVMWVTASRSEFAIRRAVGARGWQIRSFVLARAATAALAGVGIGVVFFGPALWPEIAQLIPGVSYWQPRLVLGAAIGLVAVAVLAALGPAWRAARSNPCELTSDR